MSVTDRYHSTALKLDIIDARTEDWIGQFISNPLCNKKLQFEYLRRFLRSSIVHLPTAHFNEYRTAQFKFRTALLCRTAH